MADNRHFTNAIQNEGGSPVYVEDKKLAERTPAQSAASIANLKFLLANDDTEGFNTAIKAYIDEAIRSALGALVNNLDKGTAISRILATDVDSDLGTITPANLASLLGVNTTYPKTVSDADDCHTGTGLIAVVGGNIDNTPNPNGELVYVGIGSYCLQLFCYNYSDANLFWYRYRTNSNWGSWISLK